MNRPLERQMNFDQSIHEGHRFDDRVEDYQRYRPQYPREILDILETEAGLRSNSRIVDVGAGTGLFTKLFLEHGNPVIAVEPNAQMRDVCGRLNAHYPSLQVINGIAEATGIASHSVDIVTVAQAFHWFDSTAARTEFSRVLVPQGWVVIASNERLRFGDPFHEGFERLTERHNVDYGSVSERYPDRHALERFFAPQPMHYHTMPNSQVLNQDALLGRILSSSYMPNAQHHGYAEMRADFDDLFRANESEGVVQLDYLCILAFGRLS